eukprot:6133146-Pyramimonas_sp.AAC.2
MLLPPSAYVLRKTKASSPSKTRCLLTASGFDAAVGNVGGPASIAMRTKMQRASPNLNVKGP